MSKPTDFLCCKLLSCQMAPIISVPISELKLYITTCQTLWRTLLELMKRGFDITHYDSYKQSIRMVHYWEPVFLLVEMYPKQYSTRNLYFCLLFPWVLFSNFSSCISRELKAFNTIFYCMRWKLPAFVPDRNSSFHCIKEGFILLFLCWSKFCVTW